MPVLSAPLPLTVSAMDVAKAQLAGFSAAQALHGALMRKIDELGSAAVNGAANWKANRFTGYVIYRGPIGVAANTIYVDKPCTSTAEEKAKREAQVSDAGAGGSSGSDSFTDYSGSYSSWGPIGGGCIYGCNARNIGTVTAYIQQM